MRRRAYLIPIGLLTLITVGTGTALAHWSTRGAGTGQASTATLHAPGTVTVTLKPAGVVVDWAKGKLSTGQQATGYHVTRINGNGSTSAACGTGPSATITATRCTDNPPAAGNYRYRVTAVYANWTAVSATSDRVTIVVAGPAETTTGNPAAAAVDPTRPSGATTTTVPPKPKAPTPVPTTPPAPQNSPEPPAATDPPTPPDPVTTPSATP